jgi:hypothetical protein
MTIENWKDVGAAVQSFATVASLIIGGFWVYRRFSRQEESYPKIEFTADLNFVGRQAGWWIVEVIAVVENKGKVPHHMREFKFDLNALYSEDPVELSKKWGNQVDFIRPVAEGSFLPEKYENFFIDPGVRAKYSYVTRVPAEARFLILHCWFRYSDRKKAGHAAEKSVRVPCEA